MGGLILNPTPARAGSSLGIGFTTWYNWWLPYWKNISAGPMTSTDRNVRPNFLYGPMIAIKLPRHVRISSMFMMGDYDIKQNGYFFYSNIIPMKGVSTMRRYDSDTSLGVSLNRYVSINFGFKYSKYAFKEKSGFATMGTIKEKTYNDYSPALGLGVTVPLYKTSLFMLFNLSGIYCFSNVNVKSILLSYSSNGGISVLRGTPSTYHFGKAGLNTTLSFAYYLEPADMTFMIGYRYQALMLVIRDNSFGNGNTLKKIDHFYGITAGVMYTFDFDKLSGKKEKDAEG